MSVNASYSMTHDPLCRIVKVMNGKRDSILIAVIKQVVVVVVLVVNKIISFCMLSSISTIAVVIA